MSNLSVATFKTWKRVEVSTDDTVIQAAIDSAEEAINQHCNRTFAPAGSATARVFASGSARSSVIEIHDCTTVTSVSDAGNTLVPGCVRVGGCVSSVSSAWPNMPFASAAFCAVVTMRVPMTPATGVPPSVSTY